MRIDSFQPSQITTDSSEIQRRQSSKTSSTSPAQTQDGAELSSQLLNLKQQQAGAPEIRQERVDAIKKAMESGTYNVSNGQLATALFNEFFGRS